MEIASSPEANRNDGKCESPMINKKGLFDKWKKGFEHSKLFFVRSKENLGNIELFFDKYDGCLDNPKGCFGNKKGAFDKQKGVLFVFQTMLLKKKSKFEICGCRLLISEIIIRTFAKDCF